MKNRNQLFAVVAIIVMVVMALGSFSQSAQAATSDPDKPGEITGTVFRTVHDQTDENTAKEKRAFGGDVFGLGWYERPFDQQMGYMPFIDLKKVELNREDNNWIYVRIVVNGSIADGSSSNPMYGLEMDTDLDNRGEYMFLASAPRGTDWSTDGVKVLTSSDNLIGGNKPVLVDSTKPANKGYDTEIKDDPNLVWARQSPDDPNVIEFAFKKSFIGGKNGDFIWSPWAFAGDQEFKNFDLNDYFTLEEAGSPLKEEGAFYPLKGLWGVDNTARYPSGFEPTGAMPGLGQSYEPVYAQRQHQSAPARFIPQS